MKTTNRIAHAALLVGLGLVAGCGIDSDNDPQSRELSDMDIDQAAKSAEEPSPAPEQNVTSSKDIARTPPPAPTTQWIIRFRDARSLQSALDDAAQQSSKAKGAQGIAAQDPHALRQSIEQSLVQEGQHRVSALAARHDVAIKHARVLATGDDLVDLGSDANAIAKMLAADPGIEYIEPDAIVYPMVAPNDTYYNSQWHYHESTAGLNLPLAWENSTGQGVVVAVLDTGRTNHSDLDGNTLAGYDFISSSGTAGDNDGRDANPQDEGDSVAADFCYPGSPARTSSWHGTHVSGTIAAVTNNGSGVAGVAFGAKLIHARVLGKCGGTTSDIIDAIAWASGGAVANVPANANPAQVINMSLGGQDTCSTGFQNAINSAVNRGTTVVVSAGNDNADASNYMPAGCNNVITVAASDRQGNRAFYSNYGASVDVTAPGGETDTEANGVRSTMNNGATTLGGESYTYYQGTSMAAPHIAGVAALMKSANPSFTPADIEAKLKSTARALAGTCAGGCGAGLVDAATAVRTESMNGSWTMSGGQSSTSAGNPRFRLSLPQTSTVQIDLTSSADTYLHVLNESGTLIASDDDSGDASNSRLTLTLSAGNHIVVAGTYSANQIADFTVTSSKGNLTTLAQGSWSSSGGQDMASSQNPRYVLDLKQPAKVSINLMSSTDTYLYLLDQSGTLLDSDDDDGDGTNSRLLLDLPAGQFVLVAATYSSGLSGAFALTSSHGVLRSTPSAFSKVTGDGASNCPSGTFLASRADVTTKRSLAQAQLATWDIARLTEGYALRGSGYGYDFKLENTVLGNTLCASR